MSIVDEYIVVNETGDENKLTLLGREKKWV